MQKVQGESQKADSAPDIRQRTFTFALKIIKLCRSLDQHSVVGRTLAGQLVRSGTSIGANLQEAQAGQSRADFINKNHIALKEARECLYWLKLIEESGTSDNVELGSLTKEADELSRILGSIVSRSRQRAE